VTPNIDSHATVLLVADVARASAYYRDQLGFAVESYEALPEHYAYANRGNCWIHLACFANASRRPPNSELAPPDMFDLYIYVDDVDALHAEFQERGAELIQAPTIQGYGCYEIRVRDPDGYVLAFGRVLQAA
jgi:catechol 2,3-dioxygenase-like lactoylglutathione lyase family enzyme